MPKNCACAGRGANAVTENATLLTVTTRAADFHLVPINLLGAWMLRRTPPDFSEYKVENLDEYCKFGQEIHGYGGHLSLGDVAVTQRFETQKRSRHPKGRRLILAKNGFF
jgi:hypothetical protein